MATPAEAKTFTNDELGRKIRSDLNLEKLPIWKPSNSNKKVREKIYKDSIINKNGDITEREIQIKASGDSGLPTTEDQNVYYALIEHWQEHGRPDGYTAFSLNKIAKRLGKSWGKNVYNSLKDSLYRLRLTGFIWIDSYYNSEKEETEEFIETFNILSELKIWRKKKGEAVHGERAFFKFNDLILANIKNNYSKPVILPIHFSINSDIGQLIYGLLDRVLSKKNITFQITTLNLFKKLGLDGKTYKYRSKRKEVLERVISELIGLPLPIGAKIEDIKIEETTDKKDFKIIARRSRIIKNSQLPPNNSLKTSQDDDKAQDDHSETFKPDTFAEKLICKFESKILEVDPQKPKSQHIKMVNDWIEEFGESATDAIIEDVIKQLHPTREKYHSFGIVKEISRKSIAKIKTRQEEIKQAEVQKKEQEDFQLAKEIFMTFSEDKQTKLRQKYEKEFKKLHKITKKDFEKNPYLEADMSSYADEKIQEEILTKYKK